jgi:hypothetical protein
MKRLLLTLLIINSIVLGGCSKPVVAPLPELRSGPTRSPTTTQPPAAPSNLVCQAVSQTIVNLQWLDNSRDEDGFRIYRDGNIVGTVRTDSTAYQDIGLKAGNTYQYVVRAYNASGESAPCPATAKTPNPPLNVTINHIGVKFDHDPMAIQGPGDIRLILLVTDGKQTVQEILPPGDGSFPLNDYETMQLNQRVFHTEAAGDYLRICIIAYDDDPETLVSDIIKVALPVLGSVFAQPLLTGAGDILSQYEQKTGKPLFENKDDYVGYFEGSWYAAESWGIGQYNAVGIQDFKVWLSIWPDKEPPPMSTPVLKPDVTIQSVDVPPEVEVGRSYNYSITLKNGESNSVSVTLKIVSSITGVVDTKSVTVPAKGTLVVTETTKFEPAGARTITYTLLFGGLELHSLSKSVTAKSYTSAPTPTGLPLSVTFNGWYVGSNKVTTASKNSTVIARLALSAGNSGQYKMRIRRDVALAEDSTVSELLFNYDGIATTRELIFTPPYATNEAGTNGYHVDLTKDGTTLWTLDNSYPPRLRVTKP